MKKTYIIPAIQTYSLHITQQVMTTSKLGFGESVSDASVADARDYDFDDDEE